MEIRGGAGIHWSMVERLIPPRQRIVSHTMGFTFELASFTVQDGHEAALLADRPAMINALQQTFPGLLAA